MNREDAFCPACPNPETAFRIEDVGMRVEQDGFRDGAMTVKVTRPAWEVVMLDHLRSVDDGEHREVYGQCVTALAGRSVEQTVRDDVRAVAGLLQRTVGDATKPPGSATLDLRPQLYAGIPQRLAELSPWTERINAFNRRVLEGNR